MTATLNDTRASTTGSGRATWALWGTAAGVCGVLTNMIFASSISESVRSGSDGAAISAALSQTTYHLSAITGYAAVVCLLLFAAGLARWARAQASDSLALQVAPLGLVASAGALIAGYGVKGQLAAYLPGGFNDSSYGTDVDLFMFRLDDLAGYFGWFGVTVTAGCIAWLALRERLIARWIGVLGGLVVVAASAFLLVFGFTGFSGIAAPVFLLIAGIGLSRQRA